MKEEIKLKQNTLIILIKEKIHIILKYCHLKQQTLKIWQKKTRETIDDLQLDKSLGDRIFCLVDLDLSTKQLKKVEEEKNKKARGKCQVEFILSNPCFEAWLLFYFVPHPKVEQSSQKVKEQLKNMCLNILKVMIS